VHSNDAIMTQLLRDVRLCDVSPVGDDAPCKTLLHCVRSPSLIASHFTFSATETSRSPPFLLESRLSSLEMDFRLECSRVASGLDEPHESSGFAGSAMAITAERRLNSENRFRGLANRSHPEFSRRFSIKFLPKQRRNHKRTKYD
jgi:hypothetical protein